MNPVVIPQSEWLAILDALVAVTAPWNGAKVHCYKTDIVLSGAMLIGDLVECDFSGYAASAAVTWGAAGYLPDGVAEVQGDAKVFQEASPATILNIVFGWYLTDAAGTTLLFARRFDAPIVLSAPLQRFTVLPAYPAYVSV